MKPIIINKILASYSKQLKIKKILPTEKGYRNQVIPILLEDSELSKIVGQQICLIIYKNEADILQRIKLANFIGDSLAKNGFPARQTLASQLPKKSKILKILDNNKSTGKNKMATIIKLSTPNQHIRYGCLYSYLAGNTICWEAYSKKHLKLLGKSMAVMHQLLAKINLETTQKIVNFQEISTYHSIKQQILAMQNYFENKGVQTGLWKKLSLKIKTKVFTTAWQVIEHCQQLNNQQMIHLDFVRGNVLFNNGSGKTKSLKMQNLQLTGVLDFEKVAWGNRILDIARTLAFLLVDCKYKNHQQIVKYFLKSGYQKHGGGQLSRSELKLLWPLVNYFLIYDFYKFLKHNPYESLPANEHWQRTVEKIAKHSYLLCSSLPLLLSPFLLNNLCLFS